MFGHSIKRRLIAVAIVFSVAGLALVPMFNTSTTPAPVSSPSISLVNQSKIVPSSLSYESFIDAKASDWQGFVSIPANDLVFFVFEGTWTLKSGDMPATDALGYPEVGADPSCKLNGYGQFRYMQLVAQLHGLTPVPGEPNSYQSGPDGGDISFRANIQPGICQQFAEGTIHVILTRG